MTKLFQNAVETAGRLPAEMQDEIARVVLVMAGQNEPVVHMSDEEEASFAVSRAQAACGDFASDARLQAIWSKDH